MFKQSSLVSLLVIACFLLSLSGCASSAKQATYNVSGPAGANALVRYRIPGGEEKQETATLPWKMQVTYSSGQLLEVIADNTSRAGNIICAINLADNDTPAVTNEGVDQATCSITP